MKPRPLESELVVVSAPMSFAGATRRLWRRLQPRAVTSAGWAKVGWWTLTWTVLVLAWIGVLAWYVVCTALSLGVLLVFRGIRRWQRHGERKRLRHRELLERGQP
jgi:Flp pilus assembly protein TadB